MHTSLSISVISAFNDSSIYREDGVGGGLGMLSPLPGLYHPAVDATTDIIHAWDIQAAE